MRRHELQSGGSEWVEAPLDRNGNAVHPGYMCREPNGEEECCLAVGWLEWSSGDEGMAVMRDGTHWLASALVCLEYDTTDGRSHA